MPFESRELEEAMRSHDGGLKDKGLAGQGPGNGFAMTKRQLSERERRLRKELRHRQLEERYDSEEPLPYGTCLDLRRDA